MNPLFDSFGRVVQASKRPVGDSRGVFRKFIRASRIDCSPLPQVRASFDRGTKKNYHTSMWLITAMACGLALVGLSFQVYPVQVRACALEKGSCCEPSTCKCLDCGQVIAPHAPVTLTSSFQLHEVVTVESLSPSDTVVPFSLTHKPLSPPPKLARV
jgi:hypothetical protein